MRNKNKFIIVFIFLLFEKCGQWGYVMADWVQVNNGLTILEIDALTSYTSSGVNYLFVGTPSGSINGGIYISTDNGNTWTLNMHNINIPYIWALINSTNGALTYIFAGGRNNFLRSTNNGTNWENISFLNGTQNYYSIAVSSNSVFTGCAWNPNDSGGIYKSTNLGANWSKVFNNATVYTLALNNNYIYAGAGWPYFFLGVLKSTDFGETWSQTAMNNHTVYSLGVNGSYVFAGSDYGIYLSTNNGINWTQTSVSNALINAIIVYGNAIFCGGYGANKFFYSINNGVTWLTGDNGLNNQIISLCISNNYIFAGTDINGVFRRPLGELIGIKQISTEIPENFELFQNYPNPFNPSTNIRFGVSKNDFVKIEIYNGLGEITEILVNQFLEAGKYGVTWNANNFSSGIYFYRLTTNHFSIAKKMVLSK